MEGKGEPIFLDYKMTLLELGIVCVTGWTKGLPNWVLSYPYKGATLNWGMATSDPQLLCLCRRELTKTAKWKPEDPPWDWLPVPSVEEALAEIRSGKDNAGGKWPAPAKEPVSLGEEIKRGIT